MDQTKTTARAKQNNVNSITGESYSNILKAYPQLMEEDILACIHYAAKIANEEIVYETEGS